MHNQQQPTAERADMDELPIFQADESLCISSEPVELRLSNDDANHIAAAFKALSHPVRVQIVDILSRHGGDICVCDVEQYFSLTQPTISHHLKVLREAGLIEAEQQGLWVYYRIRSGALDPLRVVLHNFQNPVPEKG